jgi:hypothetical protein
MEQFGTQFIGTRGSSPISGIRNVMIKINTEIEKVKGRTMTGMIKAAALVHNETEHGTVRVPVNTGNLRHSWFVVLSSGKMSSGGGKQHTADGGTASFTGPRAGELSAKHSAMLKEMRMRSWALSTINKGPFLFMGYSCPYAVYVHEMVGSGAYDPETRKGFKRKKSGPKWFEMALMKQQANIIEIIRKNARIK